MDSSRWYSDMFSDSSSSTDSSSYSEGSTIPGFISVPMSDSSDKGSQVSWPGLESHRSNVSKMYQAYKGQLKVSVYINYGLLTVHVMMGRHIKSQWKTPCNSYAKLCLIPDDSKRTRCKTEVIHDSMTPQYDEKFSFELLEEDISKRLYISLWNRDTVRNQCEFLGCMSFGIQHIQSQKKTVSGWYYLLTAELGIKKHLQVSEKRSHSDRGQRNIPSVNQDIQWMEPHTLVVKRGKTGFGFSISGASPVFVSRVDAGSKSDSAGLRKHDCIVRIDGMNVSRSAADSVARIIKHAQKRITLEIQRPKQMDSVKIEDLQSSPRKPLCSSTPYDNDNQDIGDLNVSPWRPGRMLPMMPLEDLIEEDEEDLEMEEEEEAFYPIPETKPEPEAQPMNTSGFETHDYGWLDLGVKPEAPKPRSAGLSMATNTYSSSTLPRSFKLKRSVIKGLIPRKDKRDAQKENEGVTPRGFSQKENWLLGQHDNNVNRDAFSHGQTNNYGVFGEGHQTESYDMFSNGGKENYGVFSHGQKENYGVFSHGQKENYGVFSHGHKENAYGQRKAAHSSRPSQSHRDGYNVFPHGYRGDGVYCDTIGNSAESLNSGGSSIPYKKRVSFKDFR